MLLAVYRVKGDSGMFFRELHICLNDKKIKKHSLSYAKEAERHSPSHCMPDTWFYQGKKNGFPCPDSTVEHDGTGPLVELVAVVEVIKNCSHDGDSSW